MSYAAAGGCHPIPLPKDVPGELWLTGFSVVGPDPIAALAATGADEVVCLITETEIERRYPEYLAWLRSGPARHIPIEDFDVAPDADMAAAATDLAAALRDGRGLLVHCGAGLGRAGTLAILVLHELGVDGATARTLVRRHRPGAGPQSLEQDAQVKRLTRTVQP